jgi:hypothetical protein
MNLSKGKHVRAGTRQAATWLRRVPQPVWFGLMMLVAAGITLRLLRGGAEETALRTTETTTSPSCFVFGVCADARQPVIPTKVPPPTTVAPEAAAPTTVPGAAAVPVDGTYSVASRVISGSCTANNFRATVRSSGVDPNRRVTFTVGSQSFSAALSPSYGFSFAITAAEGSDSVSGSFNVRSSPFTLSATETIRLNSGVTCKTAWSGRRIG